MLIVGSIENVYVEEKALTDNGQLNLNLIETVAISGLNRYHQVKEVGNFPYARIDGLPKF